MPFNFLKYDATKYWAVSENRIKLERIFKLVIIKFKMGLYISLFLAKLSPNNWKTTIKFVREKLTVYTPHHAVIKIDDLNEKYVFVLMDNTLMQFYLKLLIRELER